MEDFVEALGGFVRSELARAGADADYCRDAVAVLDARHRLFRNVGQRDTDEVDDVYALRDLCRVDEDTMQLVPDAGRLAAVARNCGIR